MSPNTECCSNITSDTQQSLLYSDNGCNCLTSVGLGVILDSSRVYIPKLAGWIKEVGWDAAMKAVLCCKAFKVDAYLSNSRLDFWAKGWLLDATLS